MQGDAFISSLPEGGSAPTATGTGGSSGRALKKAQELGTSQLAAQKETLAQTLRSAGSALRQGSQSLRNEGQQGLGQITEIGAERVERLSGYLRETDATELVSKVRETARQQPVLVAGSAFVLALLGARVMKSLTQAPPAPDAEAPDAPAAPPPEQRPEPLATHDIAGAAAPSEPEVAPEPTTTGLEAAARPRRARRTTAAAVEGFATEPNDLP